MKYWILKDIDYKIYLYCGNKKPIYDNKEGFIDDDDPDCDWIEENILNLLFIKIPQNLKVGSCKRIFINTKSYW